MKPMALACQFDTPSGGGWVAAGYDDDDTRVGEKCRLRLSVRGPRSLLAGAAQRLRRLAICCGESGVSCLFLLEKAHAPRTADLLICAALHTFRCVTSAKICHKGFPDSATWYTIRFG